MWVRIARGSKLLPCEIDNGPRGMRYVRMRPAFLLLASLTLIGTGSGCAGCGQCALGALQGPINDPSNRALRRDILAKGIDKFCGEMTKHNAPLQLQADAPAIGRFFPRTCVQQTLQNGDLYVQFSGVGYA